MGHIYSTRGKAGSSEAVRTAGRNTRATNAMYREQDLPGCQGAVHDVTDAGRNLLPIRTGREMFEIRKLTIHRGVRERSRGIKRGWAASSDRFVDVHDSESITGVEVQMP